MSSHLEAQLRALIAQAQADVGAELQILHVIEADFGDLARARSRILQSYGHLLIGPAENDKLAAAMAVENSIWDRQRQGLPQ